MTESVSDILVARQRQFDSVGRPVAFSLGVHAALILGLVLLPSAWFAAKKDMPMMTISLGDGSLGVKRTGLLTTGGKRVDQVVEPKREPIVPVAPPKSVTPAPAAAVVKTPPKASDKPVTTPATPAAPKPSTGKQIAAGSALVETGAKGLDVGLSSSGGGTNSAEIDSCCTEYFGEMVSRIDAAWVRNQGAVGEVTIDFVIEKDGKITGIKVGKTSGVDLLDFAAQRAVTQLRMGRHPDKYTGQRMFMTLKFAYTR